MSIIKWLLLHATGSGGSYAAADRSLQHTVSIKVSLSHSVSPGSHKEVRETTVLFIFILQQAIGVNSSLAKAIWKREVLNIRQRYNQIIIRQLQYKE